MRIIPQAHFIETPISKNAESELKLIEKAGRVSYKSEKATSGESAPIFVKHLIERGHESVLEHSLLTVRFITDRGVSHELVRHRLASFTQESTRYCNYTQSKFGHEITVIAPYWADIMEQVDQEEWLNWKKGCEAAEQRYFKAIELGHKPQSARDLLPTCVKTELFMSTNYREWRHILKLRTAPDAHPQMRALMIPLLKDLKDLIPVVFDDISID